MMNISELEDFYYHNIASKRLYRVFSSEYFDEMMRHGLDPRRNPYKPMYREIKKLFKVLLWLEKNDFGHKQVWGQEVDAAKIVRVSLEDMDKTFIDFAPTQTEVEYYKKLLTGTGGALVSTVKKITDDILTRKPRLPFLYSIKRVEALNEWCRDKGKHKVMVMYLKGSAPCLESAVFQFHRDYRASPFGSFEHFCKVITEENFEFYKEHLKNDEFNLRAVSIIPKDAIQIL